MTNIIKNKIKKEDIGPGFYNITNSRIGYIGELAIFENEFFALKWNLSTCIITGHVKEEAISLISIDSDNKIEEKIYKHNSNPFFDSKI